MAGRAGVLRRKTRKPHSSTPNPLYDILQTSAPASSCSSKLPWKLPPPQPWRLPLGPHGNQGEGLRLGWGRGEEWAKWGCRRPGPGREPYSFFAWEGKWGGPHPFLNAGNTLVTRAEL